MALLFSPLCLWERSIRAKKSFGCLPEVKITAALELNQTASELKKTVFKLNRSAPELKVFALKLNKPALLLNYYL